MLEDGDCVDVAYLDFRKAFDLVSHKHLLLKLQKHGITGQVWNRIKAFLENRRQKVVIRGAESNYLFIYYLFIYLFKPPKRRKVLHNL